MKFSISDYSYSAYRKASGCSYEDICRMTKEFGFDGIELTSLQAKDGDKKALAKEIKAFCDELSLPIVSYTVAANFLSDDPAETERAICEEIDVAVLLGAPVLRHDAAFALKNIAGYTWKEGIADMAPYIRRVAAYAESRGVRTCSENHGYVYQDPERVLALIEAVGHKNYGWLFDVGNFSVVDRNATEALAYALPHIFHVHVKDMILKSGKCVMPDGFHLSRGGNYWRGTVLGHGDIPVAETLRALRFAGYDGFASLEFEGCEDNLFAVKAGLTYMKRCLAE